MSLEVHHRSFWGSADAILGIGFVALLLSVPHFFWFSAAFFWVCVVINLGLLGVGYWDLIFYQPFEVRLAGDRITVFRGLIKNKIQANLLSVRFLHLDFFKFSKKDTWAYDDFRDLVNAHLSNIKSISIRSRKRNIVLSRYEFKPEDFEQLLQSLAEILHAAETSELGRIAHCMQIIKAHSLLMIEEKKKYQKELFELYRSAYLSHEMPADQQVPAAQVQDVLFIYQSQPDKVHYFLDNQKLTDGFTDEQGIKIRREQLEVLENQLICFRYIKTALLGLRKQFDQTTEQGNEPIQKVVPKRGRIKYILHKKKHNYFEDEIIGLSTLVEKVSELSDLSSSVLYRSQIGALEQMEDYHQYLLILNERLK